MRLNSSAGFRLVEFGDQGKALEESIVDMVERLTRTSMSEVYGQTSKGNVQMFQFRPRATTAALEDFMMSEQKSCDRSTDLTGRPRPPREIGRLVEALDEAAPFLKHYELGWVQVNATAKEREAKLNAHVDRPGWGDVIVVFTTKAIKINLTSGGSAVEISNYKNELHVPARSAYVLAGHSRRFAKHSADLPEGRVGVVLRYYLRDLCELGARGRIPERRAEAKPLDVGEEVVARWPSNDNPNEADTNYRSCYPGRLVGLQGDDCLVDFFLHEESTCAPVRPEAGGLLLLREDAPRRTTTRESGAVRVKRWMVLEKASSTRWFNDTEDLTAAEFREVFDGDDDVCVFHAPPKSAFPFPDGKREDVADRHHHDQQGDSRPRRHVRPFVPFQPPTTTTTKASAPQQRHRKQPKAADQQKEPFDAAKKKEEILPPPRQPRQADDDDDDGQRLQERRRKKETKPKASRRRRDDDESRDHHHPKAKARHKKAKAEPEKNQDEDDFDRDTELALAMSLEEPPLDDARFQLDIERAKKVSLTQTNCEEEQKKTTTNCDLRRKAPAGAAWERAFNFRQQPPVGGDDENARRKGPPTRTYALPETKRRLAAYLHASQELHSNWIPDRLFDAPCLYAAYFNLPNVVPPTEGELMRCAKDHIAELREIVATRFEDAVKPLVVAASAATRMTRRSVETPAPPEAKEEEPLLPESTLPPDFDDTMLLWHDKHKLWIPATVTFFSSSSSSSKKTSSDDDETLHVELATGTELVGTFKRGQITVESEHDTTKIRQRPWILLPKGTVAPVKHLGDVEAPLLTYRFHDEHWKKPGRNRRPQKQRDDLFAAAGAPDAKRRRLEKPPLVTVRTSSSTEGEERDRDHLLLDEPAVPAPSSDIKIAPTAAPPPSSSSVEKNTLPLAAAAAPPKDAVDTRDVVVVPPPLPETLTAPAAPERATTPSPSPQEAAATYVSL